MRSSKLSGWSIGGNFRSTLGPRDELSLSSPSSSFNTPAWLFTSSTTSSKGPFFLFPDVDRLLFPDTDPSRLLLLFVVFTAPDVFCPEETKFCRIPLRLSSSSRIPPLLFNLDDLLLPGDPWAAAPPLPLGVFCELRKALRLSSSITPSLKSCDCASSSASDASCSLFPAPATFLLCSIFCTAGICMSGCLARLASSSLRSC
mmetsp:Transcript_303/g.582  ORF Transcript_303/g.582 Transcript_303/m.582 type:complete len:202 (+) Transcript_303:1907-2512(+)